MPFKRDHSRRLLGFAREMRHEPTDAEHRMWRILRSRRLAGFEFRRQYPAGGYVLDFVCLKECLVIELDGGQHLEPAAVAYDQQRTRRLGELGFRVVRIPDDRVLKFPDVVAEVVYNELMRGRPD
jgi:adenine-specific DNA-methyltransferase